MTTTKRLTLIALAGGFALAGCYLIKPQMAPPAIDVKMLGDGSFQAVPGSTPPDAVQVLTGVHELPVGLLYSTAPGKSKLFAVPDYPTAGEPHAVIAALGLVVNRGGRPSSRRAMLEGFRARASELGANAIFLPSPRSRFAYVVHMSAAVPTGAAEDHSRLLRLQRNDLPGYRPAGRPTSADMASVAPLTIPVKRGRCYAVAVALGKSAKLSDDGQRHLVLTVSSDDPMMLNRSQMAIEEVAEADGVKLAAPMAGRYVTLRSFSGQFGCAWNRSGTAVVRLQTRGRNPSIGAGQVWLQVFEKRISEAKLRAKKRESEAAMAAAAERNREFQRREAARRAQRERDRQARAQREADRRAANRAGRGSSGGASQYFSFSLKNECRQTVRMFINGGGNPRFSGGTGTTMSANSIRSFSGSGSKTYWIVNSSGEGISSFTAGPGQRDMRILPSCTGFAPR